MNKLSEISIMPLLPIISGISIYIFIKITNSNAGSSKKKDILMARERKSNFVKRTEIPSELFIKLNKSLPFEKIVLNDKVEKSVKRLENEIKNLSSKKILKPSTDVKNIDLKEIYGIEVFEELTKYEQNYNRYITYLNNLSKILIEDNQKEVAEEFLKEAVLIGSDVSKTYIYLIDIYKNDKTKLTNLIKEFKKSHTADSYCSKKVLAYYENLY